MFDSQVEQVLRHPAKGEEGDFCVVTAYLLAEPDEKEVNMFFTLNHSSRSTKHTKPFVAAVPPPY